MNKPDFQRALRVGADGIVGDITVGAFEVAVTNRIAPAITWTDANAAAKLLGADVARIEMLRLTESGPYGSFDSQGRPTILFERHKFRSFTDGQYDARFPEISNSKSGGYSSPGKPHHVWQWEKLRAALRLEPEAAIKSCSWGLFQVMGFHWKALGYESALDMARRMAVGEGAQLDALVRFLLVNRLDDELRACKPGDARSCRPLAAAYNGSGNVDEYSTKLAKHLKDAGR
jgi:hypothetical protein